MKFEDEEVGSNIDAKMQNKRRRILQSTFF